MERIRAAGSQPASATPRSEVLTLICIKYLLKVSVDWVQDVTAVGDVLV